MLELLVNLLVIQLLCPGIPSLFFQPFEVHAPQRFTSFDSLACSPCGLEANGSVRLHPSSVGAIPTSALVLAADDARGSSTVGPGRFADGAWLVVARC